MVPFSNCLVHGNSHMIQDFQNVTQIPNPPCNTLKISINLLNSLLPVIFVAAFQTLFNFFVKCGLFKMLLDGLSGGFLCHFPSSSPLFVDFSSFLTNRHLY